MCLSPCRPAPIQGQHQGSHGWKRHDDASWTTNLTPPPLGMEELGDGGGVGSDRPRSDRRMAKVPPSVRFEALWRLWLTVVRAGP